MNIVNVRSPYFITVNEASQIGSKVELYIWNKGTTEPTTPTYTLSKKVPSTTQLEANYNISNYIKEYIDLINPTTVSVPTVEENNAWVNFKVKRYKLIGTTYTLLDTIQYVGVNGFSQYLDSYNKMITSEYLALKNINQKIQYYDSNIPYLNLLINRSSTDPAIAVYYDEFGSVFYASFILNTGSPEIFNVKVPLVIANSSKIEINFLGVDIYTMHTQKIDECKYTPVVCSFINRFGGWEFLTFFKAQTNSIVVKGTNYNLLPDNVNYNAKRGQNSSFNINGMQTIKLNTGFVPENYSELMTDLLLSEVVLLDNKPVNPKTQSLTYKTSLFDRNINYEMEFEYNFNLINDVL